MSSPVICAVIGRTRHKMMQIEIQEAAKRGAKLIELRLDFLKKAPDFKRLLAKRPCPMIATFRRPDDGGRWSGPEEERQMLMRQAIVAGFDYIDLESDIADHIPRFGNVKRIVSYHNLDETPDDLESIYERMCRQDADIVKIAVSGMQTADNVRVLKLLRNPPVPTIALCMGDLGTCTRILGAKFGAPFTYGAFNKERSFAPGMLSFFELQKIYHFEQINAETQVFGVIGDPVGHSLSPLIHNRAFQELGINAVYVPFRVPRGDVSPFLQQFEAIPVQGYSVTIPHKEQAVKIATEQGLGVNEIGAANTLVRTVASWRALNTDMVAAMDSLQANLPTSEDGRPQSLATRTVVLLGAGGVARAIAHGLKREGAALTISNRTHDRALKLAEEVGCKAIEWEGRHTILCDTLINCTSVGMFPNMDDSPVHTSMLKPGLMVFDTIYNPETTMLIREAQERGCHVLTGVDMFVRQAAAQFNLFTGRDAPLALMTDLVRRALSPVNYAKLDQEKEKPKEPPSDEVGDTPLTTLPLIILIGYRGTGKSATARALAERLGWSWCDADQLLQDRFAKTIRQIFDEEGEAGFRDKEAAILDELVARRRCVIATGGGVVLRPENRAKLKTGVTIWLTAAPATIWQRLQADTTTAERRPNLAQGGLAEIEELLRVRQPHYEACADWTIDTTEQPPERVAELIFAWLQAECGVD